MLALWQAVGQNTVVFLGSCGSLLWVCHARCAWRERSAAGTCLCLQVQELSLRVLSVTCGTRRVMAPMLVPDHVLQNLWRQQEGSLERRREHYCCLWCWCKLTDMWEPGTEGQEATGRPANPDNRGLEGELQFALQVLLLISKWVLTEMREELLGEEHTCE